MGLNVEISWNFKQSNPTNIGKVEFIKINYQFAFDIFYPQSHKMF